MKHDEIVINYAIYENAKEYLGTTEATLPDLEFMSETMSGAGIAGEVDDIIIGHLSAMTLSLSFRTITEAAVKLMEPRTHKIDLRVAQQQYNTSTGETTTRAVKHIMKIKPTKAGLGKVAAASTADVSGDYTVLYYAMYLDGKCVTEVDPMNFICKINGTDYLAQVRKALGK